MRKIAVALALGSVLGAAVVGVFVLPADEGTPPSAPEGTEPAARDAAARGATTDPRRRRTRARRPEEIAPSGDPAWDEARRLAAAGRPLEALEAVVAPRRAGGPPWTGPERTADLLAWEDRALDAFEAAIGAEPFEALRPWLGRLAAAVLDPARRRRLELLRRKLAEAGKLDLKTILDAQDAAERAAVLRHLQRFGGGPVLADAPVPPVQDKQTVDFLLDAVRQRNSARARTRAETPDAKDLPAPPLAADDPDVREQRRLEQLEKLRQRAAEGLLEPIAAGLAWLALHQGEDGEVSDETAGARCTLLAHTPPCTSFGGARPQHRLAATSLAVLAFVDFRDQDLAGLFEPSLGAAAGWLRRQVKKDGSFAVARGGSTGYETAIALMALANAARVARDPGMLGDVNRALTFVAGNAGPDGGYRYAWKAPGDLSVTGWYVQALEAARDAGATIPESLAANLSAFVRASAKGGGTFAYLPSQGPRPSLASVGMLSLQILDPAGAQAEAGTWSAALAVPPAGRADLYTVYYDVREQLALAGELTPERRALLDALPRTLQQRVLPFAGMFSNVPVPDAPAPAAKAARWASCGRVDQGGRTVATALAVLTMEHALYRR